MSDSVFRIVAGKNEREEHVFSVIVKRSYVITDAGPLLRRESDHELREIDLYYDDGDPDWSTVEHEYELAPYKVSTDVVVIGKAYAPSGTPVQEMDISVRVGVKTKTLRVRGDCHCLWREDKDPIFTEPEPFAEMEIRYDRAYGGRDERSVSEIPFHYPRNPMGRGVALRNLKETIENLALPNIEDPDDPLTPERVIIGEPQRWHLQPLPQGFGWRQRTWYPRCALLGSYPAFTEVGTVTAEERMGLLPQNHIALAKQMRLQTFEARFNNGASLGMIFSRLRGNETIVLEGLSLDGTMKFALPGETPTITLDIGRGEERVESRLHTLSIRPDDREVDLIWRGATVYDGYSWFPKMKRLYAEAR